LTKFTVNNQPVEYRLPSATPLLWALRDASNLTGAKYGCGTGECGACTVDVDGKPVRSCVVSIGACEGTFVTTIEGLTRDRSHPVQQAFVSAGAVQCGFCTPGMIMAAAALIKSSPTPTEEEIRARITNLCRCGVYPRVIDAVQLAARIARGDEPVDAAPRPGIDPAEAAASVPALAPPRQP
jgi:isoquinoline 1-oxidoreductase alpha subunit